MTHDSDPQQIEIRAIDIVPYEHALWCSIGDSKPFANTIEHRGWDDDGEHIWFMLGTHNFYKAAPDELVRVVDLYPAGTTKPMRHEGKSLFSRNDTDQYNNERFLAERPKRPIDEQAHLELGASIARRYLARLIEHTPEQEAWLANEHARRSGRLVDK
jgi:hypothetical protein